MYVPVPEPKSNTRDQVEFCDGFTHADTVKSVRSLTIPVGRLAYSLLPQSFRALPSFPVVRGPVATQFVAPAAAVPSATGSVSDPSAPTRRSVSRMRSGCGAAPLMPLHRSRSTVACTVRPKIAGSMLLTTTFLDPGGPPPTTIRA